jgi:hypothetical protein
MTHKKVTEKIKEKKENFLLAFEQAAGNVSVACKKVLISRETYYRWAKEDPEFKQKCDEVNESLLDMAETMLLKQIKNDNTTSIIFYLKTKGKSRGYVERSEHLIADEESKLPTWLNDELED